MLTPECRGVSWMSIATFIQTIDIKSLQNRLLKVYVPATGAGRPRVSFFFSFFVAAAINSTKEANKAGGTHR